MLLFFYITSAFEVGKVVTALFSLAGSVIKDFPREKIKISTKWGPKVKDGQLKSDTSREGCREACFGSMKRLGVDYLDLFILRGHGGHGETPLEDSVRYMKVRQLTEFAAKYLSRILSIVRLMDGLHHLPSHFFGRLQLDTAQSQSQFRCQGYRMK